MKLCLKKDQNERPTAESLLSDPWFNVSNRDRRLSDGTKSSIKTNLENFAKLTGL